MPNQQQWIHIASIVLSFTAGALAYLGAATWGEVIVLFAVPAINAVGAYLATPSQPSNASAVP